jgi:hypothetical protein
LPERAVIIRVSNLVDCWNAWSEETTAKAREAIGAARDRNAGRCERVVD